MIRFSAVVVQDDNNHFHGRDVAYYYWNCPDFIPEQHFNKLAVMILQIHQQGDYKKIINLVKQPLTALDLIDQCNTFLASSNQGIYDLEKELLSDANDHFYPYYEKKQLCYLDLLVNNHFDCHHELRNVLSGASRDGGDGGGRPINNHKATVPVLPPPLPTPLEPTAPSEPVGLSIKEYDETPLDITQEDQLSTLRQSDSFISNIHVQNSFTRIMAVQESTSGIIKSNHIKPDNQGESNLAVAV